MLETIDFLFNVISLLVAIAALVFIDPEKYPRLRVGTASFFAILTIIIAFTGIWTIQNNDLPTPTPSPVLTPTSQLTPTVKPPPSSTPTPQPTPSPTIVLRDVPVPVSEHANDTVFTLWPEFPVGEQEFGGVQFILPEENNKVSTECANEEGWPTEFRVEVTGGVLRPESLHILMTGGYTVGYQGEKIGEVEVILEDRSPLLFDLVLGENIREWRIEVDGTVPEAPQVTEVYRGLTANQDIGVLDLISFYLPESHIDGKLTHIVIRDVTRQSVGAINPCFAFYAITVKSRS